MGGGRPQRSVGLDIARSLAVLFVITSHFFLNSDFQKTDFGGIEMFIFSIGQTLFMANVPLFLLLTGYLNLNKTISRKYYSGWKKVVTSYLLISFITIIVCKYYFGDTYTIFQWIHKITDFSAINYAWYIEMWLGLFLIIPFLNILWHAIGSRRNHLFLIAVVIVLTALPSFCNRYNLHIVPAFWAGIWPLMYFFIGAYIRTYKPRIDKKILILIAVVLCLINPVFNAIFVHGRPMMHIAANTEGILLMPLPVIIFLLVYQADVKSSVARRIFTSVSVLSLDIYLFSYIFDRLYYPMIGKWIGGAEPHFTIWFVLAVTAVFSSAWACSWLKDYILALPAHIKKKTGPEAVAD